MPLTEEQRKAIKYAISSLEQCGSEPEDPVVAKILGAMIDSSDHIVEHDELIGFDLEKARAVDIDLLAATDWGELRRHYCAALDEIERLRGYEIAARDLNNDLTRIAGERDDLAAQIQEMQAELVRVNQLREIEIDQAGAAIVAMAEGAKQHVLKTHTIMKNVFDEADSLAGYCEELENIVITKDARIKDLKADLEQSERVIEARLEVIDQQAAKIRELEDAHKRSGVKYAKIINELRSSVYANIPGLKKQWDEILNTPANGKIGPDADAKPREGLYGKYCISKADGSPVDPNADYFVLRLDTDPVARRAAREYSYVTPDRDLARGLQDRLAKYDPQLKDCMNIQFFGLEKPHCWQITEERKAAIRDAEIALRDVVLDSNDPHCWDPETAVLRAMLTEADHDKP